MSRDGGAKVIDRLAHDLQNEFPSVEGFSPRSLKYMRSFAAAWPDEPIVQQIAAQLPGAITWCFWIGLRMLQPAYGISALQLSKAGAATS
jgi:hypothetical protein